MPRTPRKHTPPPRLRQTRLVVREPVIGIVGFSRPRELRPRPTAETFARMRDTAQRIVVDVWKLPLHDTTLVSGGSAWAGACGAALCGPPVAHAYALHRPRRRRDVP